MKKYRLNHLVHNDQKYLCMLSMRDPAIIEDYTPVLIKALYVYKASFRLKPYINHYI